MSNNNSRTPYIFPDFSLRRLLLQGARAARGSPQLGTRLCDVERGTLKHDKGGGGGGASSSSGAVGGAVPGTSGSNKVSVNDNKYLCNLRYVYIICFHG